MALMITAECINCGACVPECPNNAIYTAGEEWSFADGTTVKGQIEYHGRMVDVNAKFAALSDSVYFIVPEKCTECVGFYDEQKCASVCPVDCCVEDPDHRESQEEP
jgi:ferredoxin